MVFLVLTILTYISYISEPSISSLLGRELALAMLNRFWSTSIEMLPLNGAASPVSGACKDLSMAALRGGIAAFQSLSEASLPRPEASPSPDLPTHLSSSSLKRKLDLSSPSTSNLRGLRQPLPPMGEGRSPEFCALKL